MLESEKFAIASRMHVQLRRKTGRVTDVEWMVKNREYAEEVLRLVHELHDPEMDVLVRKFESEALGRAISAPARGTAPSQASRQTPVAPADDHSRYITSLR